MSTEELSLPTFRGTGDKAEEGETLAVSSVEKGCEKAEEIS